MHAADAADLAHGLDEFDADVAALARLILGAGQPGDERVHLSLVWLVVGEGFGEQMCIRDRS